MLKNTTAKGTNEMTTEQRRIIAEWQFTGGWLVMWPDGNVEWYPSKGAIQRAIKRSATADIDIAEVEYRDEPTQHAGV